MVHRDVCAHGTGGALEAVGDERALARLMRVQIGASLMGASCGRTASRMVGPSPAEIKLARDMVRAHVLIVVVGLYAHATTRASGSQSRKSQRVFGGGAYRAIPANRNVAADGVGRIGAVLRPVPTRSTLFGAFGLGIAVSLRSVQARPWK